MRSNIGIRRKIADFLVFWGLEAFFLLLGGYVLFMARFWFGWEWISFFSVYLLIIPIFILIFIFIDILYLIKSHKKQMALARFERLERIERRARNNVRSRE